MLTQLNDILNFNKLITLFHEKNRLLKRDIKKIIIIIIIKRYYKKQKNKKIFKRNINLRRDKRIK